MTRRHVLHILDDMYAALDGIRDATAGKTLDDYRGDWTLKHAVQRGIEIISEASRHLPDSVETMRPEILWRRIRGIGNVLRHEYHSLSDPILWGVVADELPRLREALKAIQQDVTAG